MKQPLAGISVLVTRAKAQASDLADRLSALGAMPIVLPAIEIAPPCDERPLAAALVEIQRFDWLVVTSRNAVKAVVSRLEGGEKLAHLKIAAVGPATATELARSLRAADVVPATFLGGAIPDALGEIDGKNILFPHGDLARPELELALTARGATVTSVEAYRTIAAPWDDALVKRPDLITFTSSSGVLGTHERLAERRLLDWLDTTPLICIGPVTADTVRCLGLEPSAVAEVYTVPGLVEAVVGFVENRNG